MRKQYRILAFIILLKKLRRNSCIYHIENKKTLAKEMGISYNSFKKYLLEAVKAGVLIQDGETLRAMHFVGCIHTLGLQTRIKRHEDIFKNFNYEVLNFKNVYEQVVFSVALRNFKQQAYKIERNDLLLSNPIDDCTQKAKRKALKALMKQAEKDGVTTDSKLSYIKKNRTKVIVTGKYHVSNIIGCSPQSGLNWLKKMHNKKIIKRRVNTRFIKGTSNPEQYQDLINNIKEGKVIPVRGGFRNTKGSVIKILNSTSENTEIQKSQK